MDSAMNQSDARDPRITFAVAQFTPGHFSAIPVSARLRRDSLDSSAVPVARQVCCRTDTLVRREVWTDKSVRLEAVTDKGVRLEVVTDKSVRPTLGGLLAQITPGTQSRR